MAQEQAKSTGAAAPESKDERPNPLEAMMKSREEKSGDAPADRAPELPKRTSLAERLKAEQRKREAALGGGEAKRDETKSRSVSPSVTTTCAIALITATFVPGRSCR